jgi:hypothetical protein
MSHENEISRANPGLIAMLLDDSGSMTDNLPGGSDSCYAYVERYSGIIFDELLSRSTELKGDGFDVKPRYFLHVARYGSSVELLGDECMDIGEVVKRFADEGNSIGLGGCLGGTDAKAGFKEVYRFLQNAVKDERFRDSFPPVLFHITDGMSHTDAEPVAENIKQLATSDGNVLVVNVYIGTQTNLQYNGPEDFPGYLDLSEVGSNPDNIRLFNMSSVVPDSMLENLQAQDILPALRQGSRLFFDVRTREMLKNVIQVVGSIPSRMAR